MRGREEEVGRFATLRGREEEFFVPRRDGFWNEATFWSDDFSQPLSRHITILTSPVTIMISPTLPTILLNIHQDGVLQQLLNTAGPPQHSTSPQHSLTLHPQHFCENAPKVHRFPTATVHADTLKNVGNADIITWQSPPGEEDDLTFHSGKKCFRPAEPLYAAPFGTDADRGRTAEEAGTLEYRPATTDTGRRAY